MFCRNHSKFEVFWNFMTGLGFVSLLVLSGCGVEIVDAESDPSPVSASATSAADYELVPLSQPNEYQVRFAGNIQVHRMINSEKPNEVLLFGTQSFKGGSTYEFEIEKDRETSVLKVSIPQDLEIRDTQIPDSQTKHWKVVTNGRLFLRHGARLYTKEIPLTVEASEIVSEDAAILNFSSQDQAAPNTAGRSGGQIFIKASKITGRLHVEMRGENGGVGLKGEPWATPAAKGKDLPPVIGSCALAKKGGKGEDGKPGRQGGVGGNGGYTGDLHVQTDDLEKIVVTFAPGQGGRGGEGGEGQRGGAGGQSSHLVPMPQICTGGHFRSCSGGGAIRCPGVPGTGDLGGDGAKGNPGLSGVDGLRGRLYRLTPKGLVEIQKAH
jgi:hypothetical protein